MKKQLITFLSLLSVVILVSCQLDMQTECLNSETQLPDDGYLSWRQFASELKDGKNQINTSSLPYFLSLRLRDVEFIEILKSRDAIIISTTVKATKAFCYKEVITVRHDSSCSGVSWQAIDTRVVGPYQEIGICSEHGSYTEIKHDYYLEFCRNCSSWRDTAFHYHW